MLLEDIYSNSAYLSDEETTEEQVVLIANQCFSVVNSKARTNLPFWTEENYSSEEYWAVSASWQFRLVEPYLTWAILNNDGAENGLLDDHYARFLEALNDFKNNGLGDIVTEVDDGNGNMIPTGFEGNSKRSAKIKHGGVCVNPWASRWY